VLTAVATRTGNSVEVSLLNAADGEEESHSEVEPKDGPSPIVPELKELVWGAGAFIVFAVLMRLVLFPRVKKGMEARYSKIHSDEEVADTARASARAEVAEYEGQLASVRAEAYERVNAARRTLEAERTERLAAVNAGIDERRRDALAAAADERAAVRGDVESAAADVLARTVELAIGAGADADAVRDAVSASMMEGAGR
jgi:F-type H+-transporting ATPase subunit b